MDIKAFKTSGILELYVLGLASEEEAREVEALMEQHPEIAEEVAAIRDALDRYAEAHGVNPPEGLKERLLHKLESPTTGLHADKTEETLAVEPGRINWTALGMFLLATLLAGAIAAAWHFYEDGKSAREELRAARAAYEQLQKECELKEKSSAILKEQLIALRDQSTIHVPLSGTKLASTAYAMVYYNPDRKAAFLDALGLPPPPKDKQYQLWAIVKGKPLDMGVFEIPQNGELLQPVPFVENPDAFAITLEPRGGRPEPSLDQLYVIGNVKKS